MAETDRAAQDFARSAVERARGLPPAPRSAWKARRRRLDDIEREIRDMLEVEPRRASRRWPRSSRAPTCRRCAEIEADLEKLRRDRERLGAVNLRAEEELREVETQHTALDHRARRSGRGDQAAAPGHPEPQPRSARAAADLVRDRQRPFQAAVHRTVRRRRSGAASDRERRSARSRPRNHRQAARQEAADAVAAVRRRAGADRAGADLRGVPHQPVADLRAGRSRRAARRPQRRAVLQPAARDDRRRPTRASSSSRTIRSRWRG